MEQAKSSPVETGSERSHEDSFEPCSREASAPEAGGFWKNFPKHSYTKNASDAATFECGMSLDWHLSDDKEASDAECLTLNFSSLLDKARVLFQSLADEATKSSPSVGGTTGIRGSLSRHTHACQVLSKSLLLALLHFLLPLHSTGS